MIRRVVVLAVGILIVVAMVRVDNTEPMSDQPASPQVGPVALSEDAPTVWFCPAGGAGTDDAPAHQIVITNRGTATTASVTGFRTDSNATTTVPVEVPEGSQQVVVASDIGPDVFGVSVEVAGGQVVVSHRLVSAKASDQSDCLPSASSQWFFAAADTERGASARLWLLNPFPTDASVDITRATADGVRTPNALRGIIVPARSSKMIELGESVERRLQFAFSVRTRGGRVVAELAQTMQGRGLRLQVGQPQVADAWVFADSFGGSDVSDQLMVYNPAKSDASVSVSVMPNNVDPASAPEPFILDIAAQQFAVIDLSAEARVPPDGLRSIRVDVLKGTGVVATQVVSIAGPGGDGTADTRPTVAGGLAGAAGSSVQATEWFVSSVDPEPDSQSTVIVANREATIALVTLSSVANGAVGEPSEPQEIPPHSILAINVSGLSTTPAGVIIKSSEPVVVAARTTSNARADLATWPAVPVDATMSSHPASLGGR